MNERIGDAENPDPIASQMLAVWRDRTGEISALIERTSILMDRARDSWLPPVLCHADVHTANLLVGADGGLYVVDWDDAMLAPKERDLMFVLADAGGSDRERFFDGYGAAEIDATALAYYQHDWAIEDIGAFAEEILDIGSAGAATRSNSLGWFKRLFAPGEAVETALRNDVDFGMTTEMASGGRSHAK